MRGFIILTAVAGAGLQYGLAWRMALREGGHQGGQPSEVQPGFRDSHGSSSSHHCPGDCYLAKTPQAAVPSLLSPSNPGAGASVTHSPQGATRSSATSSAGSKIWLAMLSCTKVWPLGHQLCSTAIDCACASPVKGKGAAPMLPTLRPLERGKEVFSPCGGQSSAETM